MHALYVAWEVAYGKINFIRSDFQSLWRLLTSHE